jgi:UDP-N-acetylmuramoyl-tripeptide--D-alanyl-D-alanine ligase
MTDLLQNTPMIAGLYGILIILGLWFSVARGTALMMFFQQEEYDNLRFLVWHKEKRAYDIAASLWIVLALVFSSFLQTENAAATIDAYTAILIIPYGLAAIGFLHGVTRSHRALHDNKKPLVRTARVKRIGAIYALLTLALLITFAWLALLAPFGSSYTISVSSDVESWFDTFAFLSLNYDWRMVSFCALMLVFVQALPLLVITANKLLEPFEERVKARFRDEAITKFNALKPTVVAITGSFGKTSTKHILAHILDAAAPTLATPGSVNTEMGITRVIREQLTPDHQYFIVEMGAYGPGSIARLCRLTPPDVALITAVGAAHYERFKSLETVAAAKFEIAEAVFAKGGTAVINTDGIPKNLADERRTAVPGTYLTVGATGALKLIGYTMTPSGLTIDVEDEDGPQTLKAPIFGEHQAGNIVMAAATARAIGLPWAAIKGALASLPQIRFRLEVSSADGAPTVINDAYNSNPVGFAGALDCLDVLVKPEGRRILVTPGMVELGAIHDAEHERLGMLAAQHADIVCVVTPERIPTFVKGLTAGNDGSTTVMTFALQAEAEAWVKANWRPEDAVLFENNLPDLYEASVQF